MHNNYNQNDLNKFKEFVSNSSFFCACGMRYTLPNLNAELCTDEEYSNSGFPFKLFNFYSVCDRCKRPLTATATEIMNKYLSIPENFKG